MNINWQQVIGALLISGITWVAANFMASQSEILIVRNQMDVLTTMIKEVRADQKEQQKLYALKTDLDRVERRVEKLENK